MATSGGKLPTFRTARAQCTVRPLTPKLGTILEYGALQGERPCASKQCSQAWGVGEPLAQAADAKPHTCPQTKMHGINIQVVGTQAQGPKRFACP